MQKSAVFSIRAVIRRLDISAFGDELSAVRYLDPRNDLVFKKVFSRPRLLKSFLNALLPLKEPVEELEYLPVEELDAYDRYWDSIRCEVTLVEEAFDKGMGQGMEEGMAKGMEQAKLEMAAKLKRQGLLTGEQIAAISGLPVEQVADI